MDGSRRSQQFDDLTGDWAGGKSRRALLRQVIAGAAAAFVAAVGARSGSPAPLGTKNPRSRDGNVVTGTCQDFVDELDRNGVIDANKQPHPRFGGWTICSFAYDVTPHEFQFFDVDPAECCKPRQVGWVCRSSEPITTTFTYVPHESLVTWNITGPVSAECSAAKQQFEDTTFAHEEHHVQDCQDIFNKVLAKHGFAQSQTEPVKACGRTAAAADAHIQRTVNAMLKKAKAASSEIKQLSDKQAKAFHKSPDGQPAVMDCSKCCPDGQPSCNGACCPSGTTCEGGRCAPCASSRIRPAAGGGQCPECRGGGGVCGEEFPPCSCGICAQTSEGEAACVVNALCQDLAPCGTSADCPPGSPCVVISCCDSAVCAPGCNAPPLTPVATAASGTRRGTRIASR